LTPLRWPPAAAARPLGGSFKARYRCGFAWHKGNGRLAGAIKSLRSRKARRFALPLAVSLSLLALGACGQEAKKAEPAATSAPEAKEGVAVTGGTFLLPVIAGNPGAAYFVLDNQSPDTLSIASIAINGAGKAEIHQTMGGQMQPVDRIDVEPKVAMKSWRLRWMPN
jgi:hypothetical protein